MKNPEPRPQFRQPILPVREKYREKRLLKFPSVHHDICPFKKINDIFFHVVGENSAQLETSESNKSPSTSSRETSVELTSEEEKSLVNENEGENWNEFHQRCKDIGKNDRILVAKTT